MFTLVRDMERTRCSGGVGGVVDAREWAGDEPTGGMRVSLVHPAATTTRVMQSSINTKPTTLHCSRVRTDKSRCGVLTLCIYAVPQQPPTTIQQTRPHAGNRAAAVAPFLQRVRRCT